jgi:hypothetical protein
MKRAIWIITVLSFVQPSFAAEQKKRTPAAEQKPAAQAPAPKVDAKAKDEVIAARYMFRRRVDLCAPPQRCDGQMLAIVDAAEERFVTACRVCAAEKKCEEDRKSIRTGKSSGSFSPCE